MTMVNLPHPMALTPFGAAVPTGYMTTATGSNGTFTFNAAGDKVAILFTARTTDVPDLISFFVNAVTSAGTTGDIEATLETLTAGSPAGAVTNSATGTGTISTAEYQTISGMAGTATVTPGVTYAIVLTAGAGWNRNLAIRLAVGTTQGAQGFPFVRTKDSAGAWTTSYSQNMGWCFGIANSSGTYLQIPGLLGSYKGTLETFSSSTNPDERGNRFVLDAPMRLCGCVLLCSGGSAPGANDDIEIKLLTSHTGTPSEELTYTHLGEDRSGGLSHIIMFGDTFECAAGTTYALTMEALGSETQGLLRWEWTANADLAGILGTDFYSTTRNDGGSCTDTNDMIYGIFPIFDQIDNASGGGGGGLAANPARGFIA